MKLINKLVIVGILCSFSLPSNLFARTCAKNLKTAAKWEAVIAAASTLAVPIGLLGAMIMPSFIRARIGHLSDAARLEAASTIIRGGSENEIAPAQERIDRFYGKLVKKYPEMTISKADVVDLLNKINLHQLGEEACNIVKIYRLTNSFFPEQKRDERLLVIKKENERMAREQEAARIRDERNNATSKNGISFQPKDNVMVDIDVASRRDKRKFSLSAL